MRYSYIIADFYGIKLSREDLALVDAHFLTASHHFFRSESDELSLSRFHQELFWKHITRMMGVIMKGDYRRAFDNTQRGLDRPQGWDPTIRFQSGLGDPSKRVHLFPDPEMFSDFLPDIRYPIGDHHPYDSLLENPQVRVAQIRLESGFA